MKINLLTFVSHKLSWQTESVLTHVAPKLFFATPELEVIDCSSLGLAASPAVNTLENLILQPAQ